jgi:hypothetical protein
VRLIDLRGPLRRASRRCQPELLAERIEQRSDSPETRRAAFNVGVQAAPVTNIIKVTK